jgi:hypothetical protein
MSAPDHASRDHALYAPSAAERWINCPGSIEAQRGLPDTPSEAALEGTECHEAASAILEGEDFDRATRGLTNAQILLVEEYTSAIRLKFRALQKRDPDVEMIVERRMRAPALHPDYHGTGDGLMVSRRMGVLHVDDLKCGWKPVAVRKPDGRLNFQLGSYVLLALAELGVGVSRWLFNPEDHGFKRILLTVHQPRVYDRPETTRVEFGELRDFLDTVVEAIDRIEAGDTSRKADPSWCHFCLAKGRCPTLRAEASKRAASDFEEGVTNLPLDLAAELLAEADWLEAQAKGARESVYRALSVGRQVPGSKLVAKQARKHWTDFDAAERLAAEYGVDTNKLYSRQPISPAQFIQIVKLSTDTKEFPWKELEDCFTKKSSGNTVAPADDPRPAVQIRPGDDFAGDEED